MNIKKINQKELSYEDHLGNITKDLSASEKISETSRLNILFKSKHQGFGCSENQRQALLHLKNNYTSGPKLSALAPLFEQLKNVNVGLFSGILQFSKDNQTQQNQILIIDTKNNTFFIEDYSKETFDLGRLNNLVQQNVVGINYIIMWYNGNDPKYINVVNPVLKGLKLDISLKNTLNSLAGISSTGQLVVPDDQQKDSTEFMKFLEEFKRVDKSRNKRDIDFKKNLMQLMKNNRLNPSNKRDMLNKYRESGALSDELSDELTSEVIDLNKSKDDGVKVVEVVDSTDIYLNDIASHLAKKIMDFDKNVKNSEEVLAFIMDYKDIFIKNKDVYDYVHPKDNYKERFNLLKKYYSFTLPKSASDYKNSENRKLLYAVLNPIFGYGSSKTPADSFQQSIKLLKDLIDREHYEKSNVEASDIVFEQIQDKKEDKLFEMLKLILNEDIVKIMRDKSYDNPKSIIGEKISKTISGISGVFDKNKKN